MKDSIVVIRTPDQELVAKVNKKLAKPFAKYVIDDTFFEKAVCKDKYVFLETTLSFFDEKAEKELVENLWEEFLAQHAQEKEKNNVMKGVVGAIFAALTMFTLFYFVVVSIVTAFYLLMM